VATETPRRPPRGSGRRRPPRTLLGLPVAGRATHEFWLLAATVVTLLLIGLVMTFSASFVRSAADTGDAFVIFQRQLLWCLLGLPGMVVAALVDYRRWSKLAVPLIVIGIVAVVAVLIPGVGVAAHGARRWIALGPASFQPTELLKLAVVLYLSYLLAGRWPRIRRGDLHALLMPALPLLGFLAVLIMGQPDLETAALVMGIGVVILYVAGLPFRIIGGALGAALVFGAVAIASTPFRRARLRAWLDPMAYAGDWGYQTTQGFIALGAGGVFGRGLGQGRGQWLYVPNAHTDFIFAIIGEELGLVGALFVLLLFVALAIAGVRTARNAPDPFGRLLASGITGWLLMQGGMNMGSVVGLLPVTGVTLPLVSFGGSSLVFTMLGVGLLMSIARAGCPPGARRRQ
jgi:cell division protein FtsW